MSSFWALFTTQRDAHSDYLLPICSLNTFKPILKVGNQQGIEPRFDYLFIFRRRSLCEFYSNNIQSLWEIQKKKTKEWTSLRSHVMNYVNDARIRTTRVSQYTLRVQVGSMQSIKRKIKGGILVSKSLHRSPLCLCAYTELLTVKTDCSETWL